MHQGVIKEYGTEQPNKSRVSVDDALMAARNKAQIEMALEATLEAIFTVMGKPNTTLRQCLVAMDKWLDLVVAPHQTILGLALNTRQLSVAILPDYRANVLHLIDTTWRGRDVFLFGTGSDPFQQAWSPWGRNLLDISPSVPHVNLDCTRFGSKQVF